MKRDKNNVTKLCYLTIKHLTITVLLSSSGKRGTSRKNTRSEIISGEEIFGFAE